jgi:Phytochelatin synthase
VLNEQTDAILPREVLAKQGMTLDQLGALLALHPAMIEVHHAADGGLDAFRASARGYLAARDHFVIVNYLRRAIGQQTGGHISPLAAYDAAADRFLILDVARYSLHCRAHDHKTCLARRRSVHDSARCSSQST